MKRGRKNCVCCCFRCWKSVSSKTKSCFDTSLHGVIFVSVLNSMLILFYSLACRCAVAAKSKSYEHFGLQFYAECWGGVNASSNYQMHGPTVRCIDSKYQVCNKETSAVCVGEAASNFVYKIGMLDYTQPRQFLRSEILMGTIWLRLRVALSTR